MLEIETLVRYAQPKAVRCFMYIKLILKRVFIYMSISSLLQNAKGLSYIQLSTCVFNETMQTGFTWNRITNRLIAIFWYVKHCGPQFFLVTIFHVSRYYIVIVCPKRLCLRWRSSAKAIPLCALWRRKRSWYATMLNCPSSWRLASARTDNRARLLVDLILSLNWVLSD